jgi:hypothetical protein
MSVDEKTLVGYVDVTPTWTAIAPSLVLMIENGTPKARGAALVELMRMANLADCYVQEMKRAK